MTRIGGVPRPRPGDAYLSRPRDPTAPRQCLRPRSASFRSSFGPSVLPFDAMAHPGFLPDRSEEHTSELQSPIDISYAVFCLKKKKKTNSKRPTIPSSTTTNRETKKS